MRDMILRCREWFPRRLKLFESKPVMCGRVFRLGDRGRYKENHPRSGRDPLNMWKTDTTDV
jgi:hypothetical protein